MDISGICSAMNTRWLVTGAGGMLGSDLVQVLQTAGHQTRGLSRHQLDICDVASVADAVSAADVVVNCAAWTDVDAAEEHEAEAFAINALGAANLARACRRSGAVLVQLSTDYVVAGTGDQPHLPDATMAPVNAYGRTKAAGEWAVRSECERAYIVRTAWLYGRHGPNFVATMLRLMSERDTVSVVDDQLGQPTWTRDVAKLVHWLVDQGRPYGTYHGTAAGAVTWWGFARAVFEEAGADPERVLPTTSADFPRPARRPANSVLAHVAGETMPDWRASLREYLHSIRDVEGAR